MADDLTIGSVYILSVALEECAVLQAAATIYAAGLHHDQPHPEEHCVQIAQRMLDRIHQHLPRPPQ